MLNIKRNTLKPFRGSVTKRTRVGRGNASGLGGECGRGHKGAQSRSGYKSKPGFEGGQMPLYKKMPKRNGFVNIHKVEFSPVNLAQLSDSYSEGETVDLQSLVERGLVRKHTKVKVLGSGDCNIKLTVVVDAVSAAARVKLEAAGSAVSVS